jgi:cytidyltransferase-like protein
VAFDPIHSGHIHLMQEAKKLGDKLIVAINSGAWLVRKKGAAFMPIEERATIISALSCVDEIEVGFNDADNTACDALERIKARYPFDEVIFANGGDRGKDNIPEMKVEGVSFVFGVGGNNKANSSSWILQEWKAPKTNRNWGYYRVLHEVPGVKVKELTVDPGKKLSMQRHQHRSEYWLVSEGEAVVNLSADATLGSAVLSKHDDLKIPELGWHQLTNQSKKPVRIIEIQFGESCVEEDIERVDVQEVKLSKDLTNKR